MARTIESPGVEINEIDLSNITNLPIGTNILVQGFTQRGPTNELTTITSLDEYERVFGVPNTPAEKYSYITARQVLSSPGNLIFNRLPYGSALGTGSDNKFTALAFPYTVIPTASATWIPTTTTTQLTTTSQVTSVSSETFDTSFTAGATAVEYIASTITGVSGLDSFPTSASSYFFASTGSGIENFPIGTVFTINDPDPLSAVNFPVSAEIINTFSVPTTGDFAILSASGPEVYFVEINDNIVISGATTFEYTVTGTQVTTVTTVSSFSSSTVDYNVDLFEPEQFQGIVIGEPELFTMETSAYENLTEGNINAVAGQGWSSMFESSAYSFDNSLGSLAHGAIIITNDNKTAVEDDFSGFYVSISDNTNLEDDVYDKVQAIHTRKNGQWKVLSPSTLTSNLTSTGSAPSISETIETSLGFNFGQGTFNDMVKISTFRLRPDWLNSDTNSPQNQLQAVFQGSVPGSISNQRMETVLTPFDPQPSSVFLENAVDRFGNGYITTLVNPILASSFVGKIVRTADSLTNGLAAAGFDVAGWSLDQQQAVVDQIDNTLGTTSRLFALGEYAPCGDKNNKIIGELPLKIERGFREALNRDLVPLDIVVDAGLSTINVISKKIVEDGPASQYRGKSVFDDAYFVDPTDPSFNENWLAVSNTLQSFVVNERKDCMFIVDPPRGIFVQGRNTKVIDRAEATFSRDIVNRLRTLLNPVNTSYGAVYGNWVRTLDPISDTFFWAPFSGFAAAIMARVDATFFPWFAPAGLNNGLVTGVVDLAISPNQKERDQLYRHNINPVANFPGDGFVVFGQKTLQTKPSALDRINVRRLFLTLQKATRRVARYFVFEPNTIFTRTRLINVLTPIFENAKNNQGVYDYMIVCDERNNTPDVIDRNE